VTGAVPVAFGTAEFVADPRRSRGWTLLLDGVAQSYVDLDDPMHLEFEYVRRLASVIDAIRPRGSPMRVLHLGGGGMTLPRYVAATRPGSRQDVVERDGALVDLVRATLPLPVGADVRVLVGDARAAIRTVPVAEFDLVITDVLHAAQVPLGVVSLEFVVDAARLLRPGGVYAVNLTDLPPLAFSRVHAATLGHAFADVCVVASPGMLRGRRFGNVILAAARRPGELPVDRLRVTAGEDGLGGRLLYGADLTAFVGGARPLSGTDRTGLRVAGQLAHRRRDLVVVVDLHHLRVPRGHLRAAHVDRSVAPAALDHLQAPHRSRHPVPERVAAAADQQPCCPTRAGRSTARCRNRPPSR
jgi:spermidine synthase